MKKICVLSLILSLYLLMTGCGTKSKTVVNKVNKVVTTKDVSTENNKNVNTENKGNTLSSNDLKKTEKTSQIPRPKLKEKYTSVDEYLNDIKKIQKSYSSYTIKGNLKMGELVNMDFISSIKGNKLYNEYPDIEKLMDKISIEIGGVEMVKFPIATKFISDGVNDYFYGFNGNTTIGVKAPFVINASDGSTNTLSKNEYYKNIAMSSLDLKKQGQKPKFIMDNAIYNGFQCRLIEMYNITTTKKFGNKEFKEFEKSNICVSDEYALPVYSVVSTYNPLFNMTNSSEFNVKNIEINNVDDSIFYIPPKILTGSISLDEFNALLRQ